MKVMEQEETASQRQPHSLPAPPTPINTTIRRAAIGIASGLIGSIALVATLHNPLLGMALGTLLGGLYGLAFRPAPFAYAESMFTAAALGIPVWTGLSIIVLPILSGNA